MEYTEGYNAYELGLPVTSNPYRQLSPAWDAWDRGWWQAWKEDKRTR